MSAGLASGSADIVLRMRNSSRALRYNCEAQDHQVRARSPLRFTRYAVQRLYAFFAELRAYITGQHAGRQRCLLSLAVVRAKRRL